jgi:hypothetical protein
MSRVINKQVQSYADHLVLIISIFRSCNSKINNFAKNCSENLFLVAVRLPAIKTWNYIIAY